MLRVALCVLIGLAACHPASPRSAEPPTPVQRRAGAPVARGDLATGPFHATYAVILPPGSDAEAALTAVRATAKARGIAVRTANDAPGKGRVAVVGIGPFEGSLAEMVATRAIGIDDAGLDALGRATQQIFIDTFDDRAAATAIHDGAELARAASRVSGGWIGDISTAWFFSGTAFDEKRPPEFAISAHVVTTMLVDTAADGSVTLTTAGLAQAGLPEVTLEHASGVPVDELHFLVSATAQTLLERGGASADGKLTVDLAALRTAPWPELAATIRKDGGDGVITWTVTWVAADPGEPLLVSLAPPGDGPLPARLHASVEAMFGQIDDSLTYADDDDAEMIAARDLARKELTGLEAHFARGIPSNERLIVKAPFATDSGSVEWIWVEVNAWKGATMTGVVINEPTEVSSLEYGDAVEVNVAELFDYIHYRADGTEGGGHSNKIIERRRSGK